MYIRNSVMDVLNKNVIIHFPIMDIDNLIIYISIIQTTKQTIAYGKFIIPFTET